MLCKLLSFKGSQNYYILTENGIITCSINIIFIDKRPYLGALSTKGETQKQLNKRPAKDPIDPSRAPKRLRVPYMEDLYPTSREDKNLVDNKLLAWL